MEQGAGLKQMEGRLAMVADRLVAVKAKLEDLLFRAQRIAAAAKKNAPNSDTMYGYDLQNFRQSLRTFLAEIEGLPTMLGVLERQAVYDETALKSAQAVMRVAARLAQALGALHETALLAHQHIRESEHKVAAWYLAQEIEEIARKGLSLPTIANKIVIATSTPQP